MNNSEILAALDAAEKAMDELYRHTKSLHAIARATIINAAAKHLDDDEWTRMPSHKRRCPISNWSRTTIESNAKKHPDRLRTKLVAGGRYCSGRDVRAWLSNPP